MNARDVLHALQGVKRSGDGWTARCPAHDDKRNSLSVKEGDGGRVLLYCYAGCSFQEINTALGIRNNGSRSFVATYDYRDERGELLFQSVRLEPKGFFQRRAEGTEWSNNLNGVRRVIYRLPELLAAPPDEMVCVVEGEKDADRLASLGLVATTNAGGAGKWRDEYSQLLLGRKVVILPDNDEPGAKHAEKVAQSLRGVASCVCILALPNLPPKGDVSDWLDAGGTVEELRRLIENASDAAPNSPDAAPLKVVRMADVEPETVSWLWHPYIALGKLTIIEGDPGIGKSWFTCALASAVSRGINIPGVGQFAAGVVLMLSAEDGLADTLRPRLDAVGADCLRVHALAEPLTLDAPGLAKLEAMIIELKPLLIIIDPYFAFTGAKVDIHRANECRAISAPLAAIAERQNCAIVAVRHLSKARGGGHALNAGIGSIDLSAAVRSVLLVGADPDDPSRRAIVQTKNNLAPIGEAVGYKLEGGQFLWTGRSTLTAGRILAVPSDEEERGAFTEAKDFLLRALSQGARDSKDLKEEARQAGISERTLRRAKEELGVKAEKTGTPGSSHQKWAWRLLAEEGQPVDEECQTQEVGRLRSSETSKSSYGNNLPEGGQVSGIGPLRLLDEIVIPAEMSDEEYERQYESMERGAEQVFSAAGGKRSP